MGAFRAARPVAAIGSLGKQGQAMTGAMHDNTLPATPPEVLTIGVDGLLVRFGTVLSEPANRAALALRAAIDAGSLPGVEETATSLVSAYVRFDPTRTDHAALGAALRGLLAQRDWTQAPLPRGRRLWRVPAVFGTTLAPQLAEAAALAGLTPEAAVADLTAAPLRVQTIGFAPGQPYLGQLPPHWAIPRQTALTAAVPEGAVVLAIRQMTMFSVPSPTGWRHVAQTALRLFRPDDPDPFLLRPGDEVAFDPVPPEALDHLRRLRDGGATAQVLP